MAVPSLIYKTGGAGVIPGLASAASNIEKPNVNKLFLPFKAVYFWLLAASACILPFLPVYMTYIGLSSIQTGLIQGLVPFVGSIAGPFWGSIADKSGKHKTIMLTCMVVSTFVYGSIALIPLINYERFTNGTNVTNAGDFHHLESLVNSINCEDCIHNNECLKFDEIFRVDFVQCLQTVSFSHIFSNSTFILDKESQLLLGKDCNMCLMCNSLKGDFVQNSWVSNDRCNDILYLFKSKCTSEWCKSRNTHYFDKASQATLGVLYQNNPVSLNPQPFDRNSTVVFATMAALIFTGRFIKSPVFPILDSTTMILVKELRQVGIEADYGRQRLWGAISWGTVSPLAGFLIDVYAANVPSFNQYLPGFCMYVIVYFLAFTCATCITFPKRNPPAESVSRNIRVILSKANILVFFIAIGVTGISVGLLSTYLFLFLAELSGSHTLMGLTLTLTCVSEVPFMFFATKLIEKFGHRGIITLTLFCYALRFGGYSLIQNPWLVLPIELLHGVTFGALWPAITSYCNMAAPDGMATTMQSLANSFKVGVGMGVGTIGGGVIYHIYGARNLFRWAAILCLATIVFYWPTSFYLDRRDARRTLQIQYEEIS